MGDQDMDTEDQGRDMEGWDRDVGVGTWGH